MADPTSTPGAVEPDDATPPPIDLIAAAEAIPADYSRERAELPHQLAAENGAMARDMARLIRENERLRAEVGELAHANAMRIGEWETERREIARILGMAAGHEPNDQASWLDIKRWASHVVNVVVGDLLRERDEARAETDRLREQIQAGSDALLSLDLYRDVPDTARATVGGAIRWVLDALLAERDHLARERDALRAGVAPVIDDLRDAIDRMPTTEVFGEGINFRADLHNLVNRFRALLDRDWDDHRQTAPSGPPQPPRYRTAIAVNDVVATICHDKPLSEKTEAALEALVRAASASLSDEPAPRVVPEAPDGPRVSQAACACPTNEAGDIRCHVCGERVNVRCWKCRTPRGAGPCPSREPATTEEATQ